MSSLENAIQTARCWQSHLLPCPLQSVSTLDSTQVSAFHDVSPALASAQSEDQQILWTAPSSTIDAAAVSTCFTPLPFLQPYTSVCLDCRDKTFLIKPLTKYRNVCLPGLEVGVKDWCPEELQCLVRAALKVAIFALWPHGVEDASNSQGSLL